MCALMETWGAARYGDPCRECGFGFGLTPDQAMAAVRAVPVAFAERQVVLQHATRGPQRAEDVARNNAHDARHHLWDIDRILRAQ